MNQYMKVFMNYIEQNSTQAACCEVKTLLGMLYCCYRHRKGGDSYKIQREFDRLDAILEKLAAQEQDQVVDITCGLCSEYQQEAFEEGVLTGFRLFKELMAIQAEK